MLLVLCVALPAGVVVATTAAAYARAAAGRRARRDGCPFDNDDDAARPLGREILDVLRESVARLRALAAPALPVPGAWRASALQSGRGPIVLLVPERPALAATMTALGRRLARALDASIHLEPRGAARDPSSRAARLLDHAIALGAGGRGRTVLLVGHGTGGLVACRAAAALGLRGLRVVTLATPHRDWGEAAERHRLVDRVEVTNVYSLHDAVVDPPERAYLAGAYNVALRDEGHFGLLFGERPQAILCESLADLTAHAAAS
jgi:hypothetical protein